MTESKAREFWLLKDADGVKNADYLTHEPTRHTISDIIHVIEKSAYDQLQAELANRDEKIKDLEFQLADRSEKYRIAMDKGVDILADRVKQRDELLRECEEVLEKYETMTCVSGPGLTQKEMWAARTMLEKLRGGKK